MAARKTKTDDAAPEAEKKAKTPRAPLRDAPESGQTKRAARKASARAREPTRDEIIEDYREIYQRCMEGEAKSFDARGAANALEQISKLLGIVSPKDAEDGEIRLSLSEEADAFAQ